MVRLGPGGRCGLAAAVVLVTAAAGCTDDVARQGHRAAPRTSWSTTIRAIEPPTAAGTGFVVTAFTNRAFEVVSLAAADGSVRWRKPASPSAVAPGVGLSTLVTTDGALTIWFEPGVHSTTGEVWLTAADSATGATKWRYGEGTLIATDWPWICEFESAVCLTVRDSSGRYRSVTVDLSSGRERTTPPVAGSTAAWTADRRASRRPRLALPVRRRPPDATTSRCSPGWTRTALCTAARSRAR